jgi:hypothetical protein
MALAAAKNDSQVLLMRLLATELALTNPERKVSINELREECAVRGIRLREGNWMGSIFKTACWRRVGYTKARHKGSHARVVSVWQLR